MRYSNRHFNGVNSQAKNNRQKRKSTDVSFAKGNKFEKVSNFRMN